MLLKQPSSSSSYSLFSSNIWMALNLLLVATVRRPNFATSAAFVSRSTKSSSSSSAAAAILRRNMSTMPTPTTTTTTHTTNTRTAFPIEMSEEERYLFDLNGYLIVRNVLTPEEVAAANRAIDNHAAEMIERSDPALRNAVKGSPLYGTGPGRQDLGRVLEWPLDESAVFKSILAHPRLVPLFHGILGKGYRMDHLPFVLAQNHGAEGFQLHGGTIDCHTGEYNLHLAYICHPQGAAGQAAVIRTALLGCNVMLTDHNAGDGGFCVVPGSHKSNFKMPTGMVNAEERFRDYIVQPVTKAGDVVLFSEGTVHGAQAWTPTDRQRRACLYRFSPATMAYGRSYFGHEGGGWPTAIYEGLNDAERAVLEPPYANRLDRPNILLPGAEQVEITTRNERKKQHDQQVFGTKYF